MFENRMGRLRVLKIVVQNISLYYIIVELILRHVEKTGIEGASLQIC